MYSLALSRVALRVPTTTARCMATIKPVSASECLHDKEFWEKNKVSKEYNTGNPVQPGRSPH